MHYWSIDSWLYNHTDYQQFPIQHKKVAMSDKFKPEDVVGRECRFATYCPPAIQGGDDMHVVKEIVHVKQPDGSIKQIPNIRKLKNYQRPFWLTKKGFRNHQDKKEWEEVDKVLEFKSTQSKLCEAVARGLGEPWLANGRSDIRRINRNPYTYGTDILSTAVIKKAYMDKYPELTTYYTAAPFDTETDVVHGTDQIIMGTISRQNKIFTAIQKSFVEGQAGGREGRRAARPARHVRRQCLAAAAPRTTRAHAGGHRCVRRRRRLDRRAGRSGRRGRDSGHSTRLALPQERGAGAGPCG